MRDCSVDFEGNYHDFLNEMGKFKVAIMTGLKINLDAKGNVMDRDADDNGNLRL
jgi:hypothetical protein